MSSEFNRPQHAEAAPPEVQSDPAADRPAKTYAPKEDGASAVLPSDGQPEKSGNEPIPRVLTRQSLIIVGLAVALALVLGTVWWTQSLSSAKKEPLPSRSDSNVPPPNAIQVSRDAASTSGELARATDQMRLQRSEEVVTSLASEKIAQEVASLKAELEAYKQTNDAKVHQLETQIGAARQQRAVAGAAEATAPKAARSTVRTPSRPKPAEPAPAAPTLDQIRSALREEVRSAVKDELRTLPPPVINVQVPRPEPAPAVPPARPDSGTDLQDFSIEEDGRPSFTPPPMPQLSTPKAPAAAPSPPAHKTGFAPESPEAGIALPAFAQAALPAPGLFAQPVQYSYWNAAPGETPAAGRSMPGPSLYGPEPRNQPGSSDPSARVPEALHSNDAAPLSSPGNPPAIPRPESAPLALLGGHARQLIPRFSIARARLLIGALAPASGSGSQPLPVTGIISGPWMTPGNLQIDLKGDCNFGGVAVGNDATSRILVTITKVSCVAPDGRLWEAPLQAGSAASAQPAAIGYMAGRFDLSGKNFDTYLGLDAKKVSNEGPLLLLRFLTETAGDYAKAAAQAQVTTNSTPGALGGATTSQNVTGSKDTYIIGNSLASRAFPDLSSFITQLLADAKPYFYVEGGREAYIVLTENLDITDVLHQYLPPGMDGGTVMSVSNASVPRLP